MKTSLLICATCLIVTGCSAQLRLPSLSSALSSLTGIGASSSNGQASSAQSQSPYSGLVRDYGRNLMMAMSNIYPTLFKPPQQQQQQLQQQQSQQQQSQAVPQSPFESAFNGQFGSASNLFSSQPSPSFSFGGSTFSISPSLPFGGSLNQGLSAQQGPQQAPPMASASSPFGASFGSSINSPPSFGSLSNSNLFSQHAQFGPANSYQAALEAANGGPSIHSGQQAFDGLRSSGQLQSAASSLIAQPTNAHPSSYSSMAHSFNSPHDPSSTFAAQSQNQQAQQHHQHSMSQNSQNNLAPHSPSFGSSNQQHNQFAAQHYRPDMMSIAASAPIPSSSNSFSNYANLPQGPSSQQGPTSSNSFQQPSFR